MGNTRFKEAEDGAYTQVLEATTAAFTARSTPIPCRTLVHPGDDVQPAGPGTRRPSRCSRRPSRLTAAFTARRSPPNLIAMNNLAMVLRSPGPVRSKAEPLYEETLDVGSRR